VRCGAVQLIKHGDKEIVVDMDWEVGSDIIPVEVNDKAVTLQFQEATPLGFRLVHYGTVVRAPAVRGGAVGGPGRAHGRRAVVAVGAGTKV